jgi:hypothetical protein
MTSGSIHAGTRSLAATLGWISAMALLASGTFAQAPPMGFGRTAQPPGFTRQQLDKSLEGTRRPPPAALPGAQSDQPLAPPNQVPSLMSPNDALFDAIDRGDIAAARDALNRGAQLEARNVLGMTPLESSVDLGRNDISFLLLSMRNADVASKPDSAAPATAAKPGTASTAAAANTPKPAATAHARSVRLATPPALTTASAQPETTATAPEVSPRAADGGTPIPQAGFLGFNPAGR